jgi:hypothetical protein
MATLTVYPAVGETVLVPDSGGHACSTNGEIVTLTDYIQRLLDSGKLLDYDPLAGGGTAVDTTRDQWGYSVFEFGAVGDGSTDDTAAFTSALASGRVVIRVPYTANGYKITSALTVPANVRLYGEGPRASKLLHSFNGNFITLSDGSELDNLWLAGQGSTYTGKGVMITGTDGRQKIHRCRIIDFADFCLDYAVAAGSQSSVFDCELYQTSGSSSGKYAVNISSTQQLSAVPRKFAKIETSGKKFIDLGGCNNVYVVDSFVGEVKYTADSRGVLIVGSRVGVNETSMTMDGHNNTIVGCDVSPAITLAASADACVVESVINQTPYITDSSGNGRNLLSTWSYAYTPTLSAAGGSPAIGDGTITGTYARSGSIVTAVIDLTVGSTTNLGSGDIRLSLPITPRTASVQVGVAYGLDSSTSTNYVFAAVAAATVSYVTLRSDAMAGTVTATAPVTWATGDTIRVTITYCV